MQEIWDMVKDFEQTVKESGYWDTRRQEQTRDWFHSMITDELLGRFYGDPERKQQVKDMEQRILNDRLTVSQAVTELFK